ncbi:hypothetical protein MEQU1_000079 [Malassezia equina]|uniref:Endonuclease/exonuclease/phosphatase domain-containing protein n=1 Tax=Malassezia equina TaxID=1381935 RepID=A0AAF0J1W4_9BASI|nr:hypothetical protein MEQU1_000079 [Malassezia equina]
MDDDIARKRAERARRKQSAAQKQENGKEDTSGAIHARSWVPVNSEASGTRVRVVSWNMLAQCLVRRELFPGSDCLKYRTRFPGIVAEFRSHDFDVGCFQEVDSINELGPAVQKMGYAYEYERGYANKKHGLMIAWRSKPGERPSFQVPIMKRVLTLDDMAPWDHEVQGPSLTRITRNIAMIVALPFADKEGGIVVATTHLFWHPRYAYERVRQAAIITHTLNELRQDPQQPWSKWPIVFAGDLNDQPHSSSYTLLTGGADTYMRSMEADLAPSRVVHTSVDEARGLRTVHCAATVSEQGDEDRILGRYRPALDNELLTVSQLAHCGRFTMEGRPSHFLSAYGSTYASLAEHGAEFFKDRGNAPERYDQTESPTPTDPRQLQSCEPKWTLHSSLFRLTLDYILLAPNASHEGPDFPTVSSLLILHPESVLHSGVPRLGVCSSDHVMVGAELVL